MKNLINIIQEKLKVNSKTNISNSKLLDILDVNIKDINQLNEVITKYVKESKCNAFVDGVVKASDNKWNKPNGYILNVKEEFLVYIYENGKGAEVSKFRFGVLDRGGTHFLIKLETKINFDGKPVWYNCEVKGESKENRLNVGDNLLDFLTKVIQSMDNNSTEYKEYTNLFKDIV